MNDATSFGPDGFDLPYTTKGFIYPRGENNFILPDSEPEIWYEFHFKKGMPHQEAHKKLIRDLEESIVSLKAAGID